MVWMVVDVDVDVDGTETLTERNNCPFFYPSTAIPLAIITADTDTDTHKMRYPLATHSPPRPPHSWTTRPGT